MKDVNLVPKGTAESPIIARQPSLSGLGLLCLHRTNVENVGLLSHVPPGQNYVVQSWREILVALECDSAPLQINLSSLSTCRGQCSRCRGASWDTGGARHCAAIIRNTSSISYRRDRGAGGGSDLGKQLLHTLLKVV